MNGLPDAIFVIDVGYHKIAIAEAKTLGIPVVGVVDTNHSPDGIDYVIPGNDDSAKAIALYAKGIADAVLEGREQNLNGLVEELGEGQEGVRRSAGQPGLSLLSCPAVSVWERRSPLPPHRHCEDGLPSSRPAVRGRPIESPLPPSRGMS